MSNGDLWLWGCIGGALPALLLIAKATFTDKAPFVLSAHLIIGIIVMVGLGGVMVHLVDLNGITVPHGTPELVVVLVGAASVTILSKLVDLIATKFSAPEQAIRYESPTARQNIGAFLRSA